MQPFFVALLLGVTVLAAPSQVHSNRNPVFSGLSKRAPSCSMHQEVDSCIAGNQFGSSSHQSQIGCLWCHSHEDQNKPSHCQSLDNVRSSHRYHSGWVCDYQPPMHTHYRRHHHGLDVETVNEDPYMKGMSGKMMSGKMMSGKMMSGKMMSGKMMMGKPKEMMNKTEPMDNSLSGTVKNFIQNAPKPVQFLGGLAMGVLGAIPFQPTKVIAGIDAVENDVQNLMNKFSISSASAAANDVVLIANTIKDMAGLLQAAGAVEVAEKAAEVAAKAESPIGWIVGAGELALNGVNVYQDFNAAIKAYKEGDMFELGKRIGDVISILAE